MKANLHGGLGLILRCCSFQYCKMSWLRIACTRLNTRSTLTRSSAVHCEARPLKTERTLDTFSQECERSRIEPGSTCCVDASSTKQHTNSEAMSVFDSLDLRNLDKVQDESCRLMVGKVLHDGPLRFVQFGLVESHRWDHFNVASATVAINPMILNIYHR